jgi:hypothetical protein
MRSDDARMYQAVCYLTGNPSAARIFRTVIDQLGLTGWAIARASMQRPDETDKILEKLLQLNAVRADGRGLDGYYLPSKEAYFLKGII